MSEQEFRLPLSILVSGRGNPIVQMVLTVNGKEVRKLPHPYTGGAAVDPRQALVSLSTDIELTKGDGLRGGEINVIRLFVKTTKSYDTQILTVDLGNPECFVPIRNLKSNIPGGEGYKTQLQVIFADEEGRECRYLTVPNPKDDLTAETIRSTVGRVNFGEVKCEVDVTPYGYIRYYAPNEEEGRAVINRLITLSKGEIVKEPLDSFRASKRKRKFQSVIGTPVRAFIFRFEEGKPPQCKRFNLKTNSS